MYCEQCGKQINDDAKFCKHCGSTTGGAAEVKKEEPAVKQGVPASAEKPKKEKKISLPKREKKEKKTKTPSEKGQKGKGKLKKILLGIVVLVAAVLAIRAGVNYYLSNKIVGQIPDPIEYFGMAPDEDMKGKYYTRTIIFRSEENIGLKEKAKGYITLLKSGEYPFVLDHYEPFGDFSYYFDYSGNENIGYVWGDTIEIAYYDKTHGHDQYAVWITIHNSGNFELVSMEQGDSSVAAEQQEEPPASSVVEEQDEPTPTVTVEDEPEEEEDDFYERCKTCYGNGKCRRCDGKGYVSKFQAGIGRVNQDCTSCFGDGDCRKCGGSGLQRHAN